jgi:lipopolysaccharide heptosyltransferase II
MTNDWGAEWRKASNLLCVRLDSMGDVLMTEPALRALRNSHPGRRLTLLTSPAGAEAASLLPEVDEVLTYRAPWMKTDTDGASNDLDFIENLRGRHFDGAVIFTVYSQNPLPAALTLYLAEVPLRLAYCRENPYHLLTHWLREEEPEQLQRHEVQRQLDLVASIGCLPEDERIRLELNQAHRQEARDAIDSAGIDRRRPWLIVHPGASAPSRRYRVDGFVEVVRQLAGEQELQVVLTGSDEESSILEQIQRDAGLAPRAIVKNMSLGGLAALIAEAPLLLSNNTGPVHLAAGTGTPVVDLYALTNPQHTPWQVPSRVLSEDVECKWCYSSRCPMAHHACLDAIEPKTIVDAVMNLMTAQAIASDLLEMAGATD